MQDDLRKKLKIWPYEALRYGEMGPFLHQWECELIQPLWRAIWQYLIKLMICVPCNYTTRYRLQADLQ